MIFLNLKTITFSSFFIISSLMFQVYLAESKPAYAITKASVVAVVNGIAISSIDLQDKLKLLGGISKSDLTFRRVGGNTKIKYDDDLLAIIENTIAADLNFI